MGVEELSKGVNNSEILVCQFDTEKATFFR